MASNPQTPSNKSQASGPRIDSVRAHVDSSSGTSKAPYSQSQAQERSGSFVPSSEKDKIFPSESKSWSNWEYNDRLGILFDCSFLRASNYWKRELIIGEVYLAIRHSSATDKQLSSFLKASHNLEVTEAQIGRLRSRLLYLYSSINTGAELDEYLEEALPIQPGSDRLERYQKLIRDRRIVTTPLIILARQISENVLRWQSLSSVKRKALRRKWGNCTSASSSTLQSEQDQPRTPQVPESLMGKLWDMADLYDASLLAHITDSSHLPKNCKATVLTHVYLSKRYAPTINVAMLCSFFKSFYQIILNPDAVGKVRFRVGMLMSRAEDEKKLSEYIGACTHGVKNLAKLSSKEKVEFWRMLEKTMDGFWEELGVVGRKITMLQWKGMVNPGRRD